MKKYDIRKTTQIAVLIAIEIVLDRFCSISTPVVKIGFSFLPIAVVAILYGTLYAGLTYAIADFLGAMIFPIGPYFPGFTLTCFFTGIAYGLFLWHKPFNWVRVTVWLVAVSIILQLGLNTLWIQILTGKGYWVLIPGRALKCILLIPIQLFFIRSVSYMMERVEFRTRFLLQS